MSAYVYNSIFDDKLNLTYCSTFSTFMEIHIVYPDLKVSYFAEGLCSVEIAALICKRFSCSSL